MIGFSYHWMKGATETQQSVESNSQQPFTIPLCCYCENNHSLQSTRVPQTIVRSCVRLDKQCGFWIHLIKCTRERKHFHSSNFQFGL